APLPELLALAWPFIGPTTVCLFLKGRGVADELTAAAKDWNMLTETMPSIAAPRVICIANQKGGVGKTTTAVNLATALAAAEKQVLLIDLDPQGNASTGLGISRHDRANSSYQLLVGLANLPATVHQTLVPHLFCTPASGDLAGAEIELI